ncbi:MAG: MMPL family transporter [Planctomycetes bacterium]|nr:MMPL family transporter [Planctomycetota bacterium]
MRAITEFSIRRPKWTIFLGVIFTLSFAPGLAKLRLRTDGHALIPQHAPDFRVDREIRKQFGILDPVVVLIRCDDAGGIFNLRSLEYVESLTKALSRVEGVRPATVTSLATEVGLHREPNSIRFATLLSPMPKSDADVQRLRDDIRRIGLYTGSIVAFDDKSMAIYVGTPEGCDRVAFFREIEKAIADTAKPVGNEIQVIGAPVAEALLGLHILEDLGVPPRFLGASTFGRNSADAWHWPTGLYELRLMVARRIGLLPVTILLMMGVFFVCFRRFAAAVIPMIEVGACLVFLFGLMGFVGIPIYLTIAVVPIIITATGVCDEIHVLSRYRRSIQDRSDTVLALSARQDVVRETMAGMIGPVVRTSITTAVGFISFASAPIEPVRMFGIVTSLGVAFCMVWSLSVMPAILVLIEPRRVVRLATPSRNGISAAETGGFWDRFARRLIARRAWVMLGFVLMLGASFWGIQRLRIQDSWIDGFDPQSEFRQGTTAFNEQYFGTHVIQMCIDASDRTLSYPLRSDQLGQQEYPFANMGVSNMTLSAPEDWIGDRVIMSAATQTTSSPSSRPARIRQSWQTSIASVFDREGAPWFRATRTDGLPIFLMGLGDEKIRVDVGVHPVCSPKVMKAIAMLGDFVRAKTDYAVGGVMGAPEFISTSNFMIHPDDSDSRIIPDDVGEIESLWSKYAFIRGEERQRQIVNADFSKTLTSVYFRFANFVDTAKLMAEIREFEREKLQPHRVKVRFAGDVAVSQALIEGIVTTQVQSLAFSLVGIFLVTALLGRSWLYGVYCTLPCALSLPLVFAAMGWLGIPLGVATAMFAAMILGAGVDFAIHMLDRFRADRAARPEAEVSEIIRGAIRETGFPVTVNAVALSAGMLVLTLSQVPANARLGILLAIGLLSCLFVSMILLPAMLKWRPLNATAVFISAHGDLEEVKLI